MKVKQDFKRTKLNVLPLGQFFFIPTYFRLSETDAGEEGVQNSPGSVLPFAAPEPGAALVLGQQPDDDDDDQQAEVLKHERQRQQNQRVVRKLDANWMN